jgi:hypothetical protein
LIIIPYELAYQKNFYYNKLKGYGEKDVKLYPGGKAEVVYAILVKRALDLPLIAVGTPVCGASGYEIYRGTLSTGTYSLLGHTTSLYYSSFCFSNLFACSKDCDYSIDYE